MLAARAGAARARVPGCPRRRLDDRDTVPRRAGRRCQCAAHERRQSGPATRSRERVARITLDRPERGNGITPALLRELVACVERADLDPAVHVLLLSGNGAGFCGGYDLVESAEGMGARRRQPSEREDAARRSTRP